MVWEQAESTQECLARGCKGLKQETDRPRRERAGDAARPACSPFSW